MNTKTLEQVSHIQKDFFWATVATFFILVAMYISFLSVSVVNVSVRQSSNDKIIMLRSRVAQLEFQYVALQNVLTNETAISKGYVAVAPTAYITKESRLSYARP